MVFLIKEITTTTYGLVTAHQLRQEIIEVFAETLSKSTIAKHRTKLCKIFFMHSSVVSCKTISLLIPGFRKRRLRKASFLTEKQRKERLD
jgi:hypothetical protein